MSVLVSICCITYNHEKYIRDALDGFINQKTNFEYEIVVHDDASTDNTTSIILEYAEKYPNLIKPIIQTENMYSKNVEIMQLVYPYITSKYIALCEGDDYWCDENKLQMQVDFLEKHTDYSACTHNSYIDYIATGRRELYAKRVGGNIGMKRIIEWKNVFHTSSVIYRTDIIDSIILVNGMGDFGLALLLKERGKIYYINKVMSVYRHGVEGSWSMRNEDGQKNLIAYIDALKLFNSESNYKYNYIVKKQINKMVIELNYNKKEIDKLHDMGYFRIISMGYVGVAISIFLQLHSNKLYKWIHENLYGEKR